MMFITKTLQSTCFVIAVLLCLPVLPVAQSEPAGHPDFSITGKSNESIQVEITTGIEKYSPIMSSVPGMPLNVTVKGMDTTKLKCRWQAQNGALLLWSPPDFKVQNKGKTVLTNSQTVYWTPSLTQKKEPYTVEIKLDVLDEKNNVIGKAEMVLNVDSKLTVTHAEGDRNTGMLNYRPRK